MDYNKKSWINSIDKEQLPWPQLITGNEDINQQLMESYSFRGIPFNVLLDKEGRIIGTGYSVATLIREVE